MRKNRIAALALAAVASMPGLALGYSLWDPFDPGFFVPPPPPVPNYLALISSRTNKPALPGATNVTFTYTLTNAGTAGHRVRINGVNFSVMGSTASGAPVTITRLSLYPDVFDLAPGQSAVMQYVVSELPSFATLNPRTGGNVQLSTSGTNTTTGTTNFVAAITLIPAAP